jgi:hypothetical protein
MIVVYSDFTDGKTHVADLALIANGGSTVNTAAMTEHVSDMAIVGTSLDATGARRSLRLRHPRCPGAIRGSAFHS